MIPPLLAPQHPAMVLRCSLGNLETLKNLELDSSLRTELHALQLPHPPGSSKMQASLYPPCRPRDVLLWHLQAQSRKENLAMTHWAPSGPEYCLLCNQLWT